MSVTFVMSFMLVWCDFDLFHIQLSVDRCRIREMQTNHYIPKKNSASLSTMR